MSTPDNCKIVNCQTLNTLALTATILTGVHALLSFFILGKGLIELATGKYKANKMWIGFFLISFLVSAGACVCVGLQWEYGFKKLKADAVPPVVASAMRRQYPPEQFYR